MNSTVGRHVIISRTIKYAFVPLIYLGGNDILMTNRIYHIHSSSLYLLMVIDLMADYFFKLRADNILIGKLDKLSLIENAKTNNSPLFQLVCGNIYLHFDELC